MKTFIFVVLFLIFGLYMIISNTSKCNDVGGEMMRGMNGVWECVIR